MTGFKVVAFDCDGVLFDTRSANRAYYDDCLRHLGKPPMTDAQFDYAQMHTADAAMAHIFPDPEELSTAQAYRQRNGYHRFISMMEMAPGLVETLSEIRKSVPTAIATNRTDTMGRVLEIFGLEPFFDMVVTAQTVKNPKPDPEQLLTIAGRFDIPARELMFVGDSELDRRAARAAGAFFVAFDNPDLDADRHVTAMKALLPLIFP